MQIDFSQLSVAQRPGAITPAVPSGHKDPLWFGLGYRLSQMRANVDLPASTLNSLSGSGQGTANRIEDGHTSPRIDIVERFACVLGVSPSWIAFGHEGYEPFQQRRPRDLIPIESPSPQAAIRALSERYKGVGERLSRIRQLKELSLRDAGKLTGITHAGLDRIEKGATVPKISTCERIAVAFGIAPAWLTYGEGAVPEGIELEREATTTANT